MQKWETHKVKQKKYKNTVGLGNPNAGYVTTNIVPPATTNSSTNTTANAQLKPGNVNENANVSET